MQRLSEVAIQSVREAIDDDLAGESAKVAYYFFLSFFPLLLSLFAFAGLFGGGPLFHAVMGEARRAAPGQTERVLEMLLREITGQGHPGVLSLGILLTLWSASSCFAALTDGLNAMYDVRDDRGWWRRRGLALVALGATYVLGFPAAVAIVAGPELVGWAGLEPAWVFLRWPLAFLGIVGLMWIACSLLPARRQWGAWRETLVGAAIGTTLWVAITALFRVYVTSFGSYGPTYGVVGGVIVLLLWLYLTALALLFGGEVAAVLEQRRRAGTGVGEPLRARNGAT